MTFKFFMRSILILSISIILSALAHNHYSRPTTFRVFCKGIVAFWEYIQEKEHSPLFACPDFVAGKAISLKKLTPRDFPAYYKLLTDNKITDIFFLNADGTIPNIPPNYYMYNIYLGQLCGDRIMYSVIINKTQQIHGAIEIIRDSKKICGHISGFADPNYWGKGVSAETLNLAQKIFFKNTTLDVLEINCSPENQRCISFLQKCGLNFSHISQEDKSKNELVFILKRTQN